MPALTATAARDLIAARLIGNGLAARHAPYSAEAILENERSALEQHGFCWLGYYSRHIFAAARSAGEQSHR